MPYYYGCGKHEVKAPVLDCPVCGEWSEAVRHLERAVSGIFDGAFGKASEERALYNAILYLLKQAKPE